MNTAVDTRSKTTVTVEEVKTKKELKLFVNYPNVLYKNCPQYVPSFYDDDMSDWDRTKNPAFDYCDAKCFLAYRDGKVVGRIGAIISHKANEKWGKKQMRFSQVDFIDDYEVSEALFRAVEEYAAEMGCNEVHGPLGFTDLDREGMLVEGFDKRSMFITYYSHPYYIEHLSRLGYGKSIDWIENYLTVPDDSKMMEMLGKLANRSLERYGLHIARLKNRRAYEPYIQKVFELVNLAYAHLYGTVDLTEKQIKRYAKKFIPLINPDLVCFVLDKDENLVAFGVVAPSMAEAMKKCNGKLFPFGWMGILRALSVNDTIDMFLVAVHPDYQSTGINSILLHHVCKGCIKMGIRYAETGPMLETNTRIHSQWKMFSPVQHKRRRCFIKSLEENK